MQNTVPTHDPSHPAPSLGGNKRLHFFGIVLATVVLSSGAVFATSLIYSEASARDERRQTESIIPSSSATMEAPREYGGASITPNSTLLRSMVNLARIVTFLAQDLTKIELVRASEPIPAGDSPALPPTTEVQPSALPRAPVAANEDAVPISIPAASISAQTETEVVPPSHTVRDSPNVEVPTVVEEPKPDRLALLRVACAKSAKECDDLCPDHGILTDGFDLGGGDDTDACVRACSAGQVRCVQKVETKPCENFKSACRYRCYVDADDSDECEDACDQGEETCAAEVKKLT